MTPSQLEQFSPRVAGDANLRSYGQVTRSLVTMFVDIAGFTALSERLARLGTEGTEQLGEIIRAALGGAMDAVDEMGGDTLAFGGDAITVVFAGEDGWVRAQIVGEQILDIVARLNGRPSLIGPIDLSVKVGISAGRVTSMICARDGRDSIVHLGPGLDRAVATESRAVPGTMRIESVDIATATDSSSGEAGSIERSRPISSEDLTANARRLLPPLIASRFDRGLVLRDAHRIATPVFMSLPPVDDLDPVSLASLRSIVNTTGALFDELGGELVQCVGGDKGLTMFGLFGLVLAHADDAARAVHLVERLRSTIDVPIRAGISTGLIFVGEVAGDRRAFVGVLGDSANQAARLMGVAEAGQVVIEERTRRAAGESIVVEPARLVSVKGKAEPLAVHNVARVTGRHGSFTVSETPITGRDRELDEIVSRAERCLDRAGEFVRVVGPAGAGKTRVVDEAANRLDLRGVRIERARFDGYGIGGAYGPFGGLVRQRLGLEDSGPVDPTVVQRSVEVGLSAAGVAPSLAPLLGAVLGVEFVNNGSTATLPAAERGELTRGVIVDLLRSVRTPTLLVLDDIHWADEASLDVLAGLADRLETSLLSIVATSRPSDFTSTRSEDAAADRRTMVLGELDATSLTTIVRDTWSTLGGAAIDDEIVAQIVERAAGSPLFAAVVCALVRQSWTPGQPMPEVPLFEELLGFLTERLDQLPVDLRDLMLRTSIVGRATTSDELTEMFDLEAAEVERQLQRLCSIGFLRSSADGFEPIHATLSEACREGAAHAARVPLHQSVAGWLIDRRRSAREIAGHLEHAPRAESAVEWFRAARQDARGSWSLREAHHWAELAVETGTPDAGDVLDLAELDVVLGHYEAAEQRLRVLDADVLVEQDRARRSHLLGKLAFETGRPADAVDYLVQAELEGAAGPDLAWPMTMALCDLGRFDEAERRARSGIEAEAPATRLDSLANLGVALVRRGDLDGAKDSLERAMDLAEEIGDVMRLVHSMGDLAGVCFERGDLADSVALLDRASGLAQRLGAHRDVTMALGNQAQVRLAAGDLEGAERSAAAAVRAALSLPDPGLALAYLETPLVVAETRGAMGAATTWWQRHGELELMLGRRHESAISQLRCAALHARSGDLGSADDCLAAARRLFADTDEASDAAEHLARAEDAIRGNHRAPLETEGIDDAGIELPALDASIPAIAADEIDELFLRIASEIAQKVALAGR